MECVQELLNKNIEHNKTINQLYVQITTLQTEIKKNNKQIWDKCVHKWKRDELAIWDDKCKYICSNCLLYKNKSYYT